MTEEEISKIDRKIQKMISKNDVDENMARDLLVRLQESRITLSILQKTGIGKTVNNLRRLTTNEELSTVAKALLKNWKKLVPDSTSGIANKDEKPSTSNSTNSSQNSQETNSNNGKFIDTNKLVEQSSLEKASSSKNYTIPQSQDEVRLRSRNLLAAAFSASEIPDGSMDPLELAARVEDAIYKELKDTSARYRNRIRSRISNLKDPKNPNLRVNVLLGLITPERLAVLTAEEMASDALKQERSKLTDLAINECQLAVDDSTGTDLIQCKRCKQNNCAYTEVQTRSADEPMTLFVFCKNCGCRWKM